MQQIAFRLFTFSDHLGDDGGIKLQARDHLVDGVGINLQVREHSCDVVGEIPSLTHASPMKKPPRPGSVNYPDAAAFETYLCSGVQHAVFRVLLGDSDIVITTECDAQLTEI